GTQAFGRVRLRLRPDRAQGAGLAVGRRGTVRRELRVPRECRALALYGNHARRSQGLHRAIAGPVDAPMFGALPVDGRAGRVGRLLQVCRRSGEDVGGYAMNSTGRATGVDRRTLLKAAGIGGAMVAAGAPEIAIAQAEPQPVDGAGSASPQPP